MTVRWETTQVDGQPMRIYLGVPDGPGRAGHRYPQHAGALTRKFQASFPLAPRAKRRSAGELFTASPRIRTQNTQIHALLIRDHRRINAKSIT